MRRREFLRLVGSVAATWPLAARAQQAAVPVIGVIGAGERAGFAELLAAFRLGLKDFGLSKVRTLRWNMHLPLVGSTNFPSSPAISCGGGSRLSFLNVCF